MKLNSSSFTFKEAILWLIMTTCIILLSTTAFGQEKPDTSNTNDEGFYCDPVDGSMSNDGSESSPWASLEEVIADGRTFEAGAIIYLMEGNHGFPEIKSKNTGDVTITKAPGHNPVLERIHFNGASHWVLSDVEVSTGGIKVPTNPPLEHPVYPIIQNSIVQINGTSAYITIKNCFINSVDNSTSWTADDWNYKAFTGVYHIDADHVTIRDNHIKNVNFGIHNNHDVSNTLYENNIIENFNGDGLRGHGQKTVIQYNTVKNCYKTNGNHRDMVQVVGSTTGLVLRGNKFFAWTDPDQPFKTGCQGIGLFDGMFYNFLIENNVVATDHYHGITLLGAKNCKIINNTVIDLNDNGLFIKIAAHKDGTKSTGNVVSNNLCTSMSNDGNIGTVENNIIMPHADADDYFSDFSGMDFSLKPGAPAIDAGSSTDAPASDINGYSRPQGAGCDVGAYEYTGVFIDETQVTVTPSNTEIEIGQTRTLKAIFEPTDATNKNVTWVSDNTNVVTVTPDGEVMALSEGKATISATTKNLGFSSSCIITVTKPSGEYNVALGKTITVSSEDTPTPGGNIANGGTDDESRWSAEGFPQSAVIDLGKEYNLSAIELYTYQDRAYQYTVEASSDGSSYSQIVDRSSNQDAKQPITNKISATARYIKIKIISAYGYTGTWVSLNEVLVIGTDNDSSALQFPYNKNIIPGVIEIENFDIGSNGEAYMDDETKNLEATIRPDTYVDIEPTSDKSGENNVGYVADKEWLEYTVQSITAGIYTINFRASSDASTPGNLVLKLGKGPNGEDFSTIATIPVQKTGGWEIWETFTVRDVELPAASGDILRAEVDGSGFDMNYIEFVLQETSVLPESISLSSSKLSLETGESIQLSATVLPENAENISLAWESNDTLIATVTNGLVMAKAPGSATITVSATNELSAICSVTVTADSSGANTTTMVPKEHQHQLSVQAWPNPCRGILNVTILDAIHAKKYVVELIDITGKTVLSKTGANLVIETGMLNDGVYILSVSQDSLLNKQKLIVISH